MDEDSNSSPAIVDWKGSSLDDIYGGTDQKWSFKQEDLEVRNNHKVLFHLPLPSNPEAFPDPQRGPDKWDSDHVRLPSSLSCQYPVIQEDGTQTLSSRWELIETTLLQPILTSRDLEKAIKTYNTRYEDIWNFTSLHQLFDDCEPEEALGFFEHTLPKIINLALRLPELIKSPIPLLKQGINKSISLSQQQIACLLANAFLCTFPRRNTDKRKSEYASYPDINFNRLFQSSGERVVEKINCILNYFRRVCKDMPKGVITFQRRYVNPNNLPKWENCDLKFSSIKLHINSSGTIETDGNGMLQVDFANKFIGGGVLGHGCVQEEIRFVICPELIISKLFTECLKPQEALLIIGAEQYNLYSGYASSFEFAGDFVDQTPRDSFRRRKCSIIAIDALMFRNKTDQFKEALMRRELNKAYAGFYHNLSTQAAPVASGNWGCGAFGGEATLKSLIQLMACCYCKRSLVYFTFGNEDLRDEIYEMFCFLRDKEITVSQLWEQFKQFEKKGIQSGGPKNLYSFIYQQYDNKKMKTNAQKNNSLFKFLATNPRFKFMSKKVEKSSSSEPIASTSGTKTELSEFQLDSEEMERFLAEDFDEEIRENPEKRKFENISETPGKEQQSSLLFDSLDSYYDSFITTTTKKTLTEEDEDEDNPSKKHCSLPSSLKNDEFKQKCTTAVEGFFKEFNQKQNDSQEEIQSSQIVDEEIPGSPHPNSSICNYKARSLSMRATLVNSLKKSEKKQEENLEEKNEKVSKDLEKPEEATTEKLEKKINLTPRNIEAELDTETSEKKQESITSSQTEPTRNSEEDIVPSSQPQKEPRKFQKLKITSFFKKSDK